MVINNSVGTAYAPEVMTADREATLGAMSREARR